MTKSIPLYPLSGVFSTPWAIIPDKLAGLADASLRLLQSDGSLTAHAAAHLGQTKAPIPVRGGVAVLPVTGPLVKAPSVLSALLGWTSMQRKRFEIEQLLANEAVQAIVLAIDSPGGTVDGTAELAGAILAARGGSKPIVAFVDGTMASAAYWIGSAADAVIVGAPTDMVGSIGVAMQHVDSSGADAQEGLRRTDIFAGQYKRIASGSAPLTDKGRAYLQGQVDTLYSIFVDAVAALRGASVETVLADMADGRLFIGEQAVSAGLADGMMTLDDLVAEIASGQYQRRRSAPADSHAVAPRAAATFQTEGVDTMQYNGQQGGEDRRNASEEQLDRDANAMWDRDPDLQAEFGDFRVFAAWYKADARGLVKVHRGAGGSRA